MNGLVLRVHDWKKIQRNNYFWEDCNEYIQSYIKLRQLDTSEKLGVFLKTMKWLIDTINKSDKKKRLEAKIQWKTNIYNKYFCSHVVVEVSISV